MNHIKLLLKKKELYNIELLPSDIKILILNKLGHEDIMKLLKINKFFNNFIRTNINYINPINNIDNDIFMINNINDFRNIDNIISVHPKIGLTKNVTKVYFFESLSKFINKYNQHIYKIDFPDYLLTQPFYRTIIENILYKCKNIKYYDFSKCSCIYGGEADYRFNNDNDITIENCYINFSNCKNLSSLNKINYIKLHNCILDLTNCPKFNMSSLDCIIDDTCIIKK